MTIEGHLKINRKQGIISFTDKEGNMVLKITNLPYPIPEHYISCPKNMMRIAHMVGNNWDKDTEKRFKNKGNKWD